MGQPCRSESGMCSLRVVDIWWCNCLHLRNILGASEPSSGNPWFRSPWLFGCLAWGRVSGLALTADGALSRFGWCACSMCGRRGAVFFDEARGQRSSAELCAWNMKL